MGPQLSPSIATAVDQLLAGAEARSVQTQSAEAQNTEAVQPQSTEEQNTQAYMMYMMAMQQTNQSAWQEQLASFEAAQQQKNELSPNGVPICGQHRRCICSYGDKCQY